MTNPEGLHEAGAGWIGKLRRESRRGHGFPVNRALTPQAVAEHWTRSTDFTEADHPDNGRGALIKIMGNPGSR